MTKVSIRNEPPPIGMLATLFSTQEIQWALAESQSEQTPLLWYLVRSGMISEATLLNSFVQTNPSLKMPYKLRLNWQNYQAVSFPQALKGRHFFKLNDKTVCFISPLFMESDELSEFINACTSKNLPVYLISSRTHFQILANIYPSQIEYHATHDLKDKHPEMSAATPKTDLLIMGYVFLAWLIAVLAQFPLTTLYLMGYFLACLFLPLIIFKLATALAWLFSGTRPALSGFHEDAEMLLNRQYLPVYTVLVPVYNEAECLPFLIKALSSLDYPTEKLDIKIITEQGDDLTQNVLNQTNLPGHFHILSVPEGQLQTKPRALNYALRLSQGHFVTIYDAEDLPETDQLIKAVHQFRESGEKVACLQARLGIYNGRQNWLTKEFALEYNMLFKGFLPFSLRLGFPALLGGTSNHFKRSALEKCGGWDPYNVTEDADLGIRLYRMGYICKMLNSTTWEQACFTFGNWARQRTRWQKGWMQTWTVHMRHPAHLLYDLGLWRFLGFQILVATQLLTSHAYILYIGLAMYLTFGIIYWDFIPASLASVFGTISLFNFFFSFFATALLATLITSKKQRLDLFVSLPSLPVYWLIISAVSYRAFWHMIVSPFKWEKTHHENPSNIIKKLESKN